MATGEVQIDMENIQRISVAMATYNGEKYIAEQLLSICRQTRKPHEIVISDDGSRDATLEVVNRVAKTEDAQGIDFVVITDNPRHGYCGNFEWAIRHTTGDLVFLSDQDDIWTPDKVEQILRFFQAHPDAQCVCHNAALVDQDGAPIDGVFDECFENGKLQISLGNTIKIDRDTFLEAMVATGGIHGMAMCFTKELAADILPFPKANVAHDKWIDVCATMNDAMYYLNLPLTKYRLHGSNTCGSTVYRGNLMEQIRRKWRNVRAYKGFVAAGYQMSLAIRERMQTRNLTGHPAYITACRMVEICEQVHAAETSGRITGVFRLCKLFCTDMRYRRTGTANFLLELLYILLHSKHERRMNISGGTK